MTHTFFPFTVVTERFLHTRVAPVYFALGCGPSADSMEMELESLLLELELLEFMLQE
jgi:hypothetical protein